MASTQPNDTTYLTPSGSPRSRSGERVKPTILTFHGSGSNATIHTVQLARMSRLLKPHFDIVSCEAPFPSAAGPGVLPFFEGCGPFKRWIPPTEKVTIDGMKRGEASSAMPAEVESVIRSQVSEVLASGSKVVGVIGFSQGTRVVAGLLKGAEIRNAVVERCGEAKAAGESEWLGGLRFGVSVCGSYPPPLIPESAKKLLELLPEGDREDVEKRKIEIPTLHIQGKQDEWEWAGELLIEGAYEVGEGKSEVVRFDMGHHYPVSVEENERIRDWVLEQWHGVAYQQGL